MYVSRDSGAFNASGDAGAGYRRTRSKARNIYLNRSELQCGDIVSPKAIRYLAEHEHSDSVINRQIRSSDQSRGVV